PGVNLVLLEEEEITRLCTDVQQHGAIFKVAIVVPKSVAQRRRRNIRQLKTQPRGFSDAEQTLYNVRLDGDEENFEFASGCRAENLIIPHDFRQREGNVLLCLVLDDLGHL